MGGEREKKEARKKGNILTNLGKVTKLFNLQKGRKDLEPTIFEREDTCLSCITEGLSKFSGSGHEVEERR